MTDGGESGSIVSLSRREELTSFAAPWDAEGADGKGVDGCGVVKGGGWLWRGEPTVPRWSPRQRKTSSISSVAR